jgi:FkbM family methyltransferase
MKSLVRRPRRLLIEAADRSVGRKALATLSTWDARRRTELDVEVLYDRAWVHRIGSTYIPVSDRFEFRRDWDSALDSMLEPIKENWFFHYRPSAGDTIVDIGAGDGLDSLVFSRAVGTSGRVLAVEAHPGTFVLLEQMCRLNGLENVTPLHCAVMDRDGTVTMVEEGSHRDFYSVGRGVNGSTHGKEVSATTLDELCREHDVAHVDFLKINIEGAERYALVGAEETLARTSYVCVACHDFIADSDPGLATRSFVVDFLRERGFDVVLREESPLPWVRDHVHGRREAAGEVRVTT